MSNDKLEATYTDEKVRKLLSYLFNGEKPYQDAEAPEPGMPKSKSNPAHQGDSMAEMVDIKRALERCGEELVFPGALWYVLGEGKTLEEAAKHYGLPRDRIKACVDADVQHIVNKLNGK